MEEITLIIDGQKVTAPRGATVLEAARGAGIYIPTLCHDEQLKPLGSCWMCTVEVQGHGLLTSCSTRVSDGMVIQTASPKVVAARKRTLETFLVEHYGDCVAPCRLACPAGIDIQGYLALIRRGAYKEAVELIMESLPLPGVIGRICPHFCEQACRRNLVEQPISICSLKRFAADAELESGDMFVPTLKPKTGKRVAVVGAGPAGLSAAYYLALEGHEVTIFEALPKPGGMLRYGIPDYRLPQDVLDREIARITTELGTVIKTNQSLGKDFTIKGLLQDGFQAVFLAVGAHQSQKMGVEGEDTPGVLAGTNFLRAVSMGKKVEVGKRVAVIGGGNTAIDAARTAVRLGADEVSIVYRRSRTEMPASEWEVEEAEEEGVRLHFLAAPVRVLSASGRVSAIECVRMALGEPDASGRRRPEPIPGSEFVLPVDSIVAAIGQRPDLAFRSAESDVKADKGNIVADPNTFMTSIEGVFAAGDAVTGAATAVEAVAGGRKAALAINRYLRGEKPAPEKQPFNISKGELEQLGDRVEFTQVERRPRAHMPRLRAEERRRHFGEIEFGFPEDMARREAERCLECGCKAAHDCTLRQLATEYEIKANGKDKQYYQLDKTHPFIERDPNKCINCERCARTCLDVVGVGALTVNYRVGTAEGYGGPLQNTTCVSCGSCVAACPVGALVAKNSLAPARQVATTCPYCGVGCSLLLGVRGDVIVDVNGNPESPVNKGNLCVKGRFGIIDAVHSPQRLTSPLIRKNGKLVEAGWEEALELVAASLRRYKSQELAVVSSAKCTNEENYVIQKFARAVLGTNNLDHCARL